MSYLRRTPAQWQAIIKHWQASGKAVKIYCNEHQLPPSSFYAWKRRLDTKPESQFVEVTALALSSPEIVIGLPSGITVTVKTGVQQQDISQVLRVLGVPAE